MQAPARTDTAPGLKIDVAFHPIGEVEISISDLPGRQRMSVGDGSKKCAGRHGSHAPAGRYKGAGRRPAR